jgi:glycine/D-amino acid oxidase-like deaminating enzyme
VSARDIRLLTEETPAVTRSLWLSEAGLDGSDPPLIGERSADVAIVGGGFVGLWTAIELTHRRPSLSVVVLEQDICGGGASGRNGGQAHTWFDRLDSLAAVCGPDEALRLAWASADALEELGALEEAGHELGLCRDGWLQTATTAAQLGAWEPMLAACERYGVQRYERLGAADVALRTGSAVHLAGVIEPGSGTVQPARLVAALKAMAREAGVVIHERTPVRAIRRGAAPVLVTPDGLLTAPRVVLATGAWASALPQLARRIFVVASDIVVTPPIPGRLDALGWTGGAALCDSQARVLYYMRTRDGRAALGRGGGRIAWSGHVGRGFDSDAAAARDAAAALGRVYPGLQDVPVERSWSGPVDRTLAGLPLFGDLDGRGEVHYGVGWSGTGVVQSRLGGRILASLTLGTDDEWSRSGLVGQRPFAYPAEPIRFLGAHLVRGAVKRVGRAEDAGRRASALDRRLAALTPALDPEPATPATPTS